MTVPPCPPSPQTLNDPVPLDWLRQPVAPAPWVRGDRASVPRRLGAFLIDVLILIAGSIVVTIFFGERSMEMGGDEQDVRAAEKLREWWRWRSEENG